MKKGDRFLSYYDNNEGRKVYVTEVIADNVRFLESSNANREEGGGPGPSASYGGGGGGGNRYGGGGPRDQQQDPFIDDGKPIDISDDDLPF